MGVFSWRGHLPSVFWHCWLGHLTSKNPSWYDL